MKRTLFRYVEALRSIGIVVSTPEKLSKDRVVSVSAAGVGRCHGYDYFGLTASSPLWV